MFMICYVDDWLVFTESQDEIDKMKDKLSEKFVLKDSTYTKQFLSMELDWAIQIVASSRDT